MVIDKKEHRNFLLALLEGAQLPGKFIDLAHEVKQAIKEAKIGESGLPKHGNEIYDASLHDEPLPDA